MTSRRLPSFAVALVAAAALQGGLMAVAAYGGVGLLACQSAIIEPPGGSFCAADAWPVSWTPWALVAVVSCLGLVVAGTELRAGRASLRRSARLIAALQRAGVPASPRLRRAVANLPLVDVQEIDVDELVALCHGIIRPRVIVSSALVRALDDDALLAVLTHEAAHTRRRDPLRLLGLRIAAVAGSLLPVVPIVTAHARAECEWAADRAAVDRCGRPAVARALHIMISQGATSTNRADLPAFCSAETRIRALAASEWPHFELARWRLVTSAAVMATLGGLALWMWRVSERTSVIVDLPVS